MLLTPLSNSRVPCSFMRSLHVLARVGFPQVLQFPPAGQKHCELRGLGCHGRCRHKVSGYDCVVRIRLTVQGAAGCNCVIFLRSSDAFTLQTQTACQHSAPAQTSLCSHRKETISLESLNSTRGIQMTVYVTLNTDTCTGFSRRAVCLFPSPLQLCSFSRALKPPDADPAFLGCSRRDR